MKFINVLICMLSALSVVYAQANDIDNNEDKNASIAPSSVEEVEESLTFAPSIEVQDETNRPTAFFNKTIAPTIEVDESVTTSSPTTKNETEVQTEAPTMQDDETNETFTNSPTFSYTLTESPTIEEAVNATSSPSVKELDTENATSAPSFDTNQNKTERPTESPTSKPSTEIYATVFPTENPTNRPTVDVEEGWETNLTFSPTSNESETYSPTLMPTNTISKCQVSEEYAKAFINYALEISECEDFERCSGLVELVDILLYGSKTYFGVSLLDDCSALDILFSSDDSQSIEALFEDDCIESDYLSFLYNGVHCNKPLKELRVKDLVKVFGNERCNFDLNNCFVSLGKLIGDLIY